jgi:hypothetical protein
VAGYAVQQLPHALDAVGAIDLHAQADLGAGVVAGPAIATHSPPPLPPAEVPRHGAPGGRYAHLNDVTLVQEDGRVVPHAETGAQFEAAHVTAGEPIGSTDGVEQPQCPAAAFADPDPYGQAEYAHAYAEQPATSHQQPQEQWQQASDAPNWDGLVSDNAVAWVPVPAPAAHWSTPAPPRVARFAPTHAPEPDAAQARREDFVDTVIQPPFEEEEHEPAHHPHVVASHSHYAGRPAMPLMDDRAEENDPSMGAAQHHAPDDALSYHASAGWAASPTAEVETMEVIEAPVPADAVALMPVQEAIAPAPQVVRRRTKPAQAGTEGTAAAAGHKSQGPRGAAGKLISPHLVISIVVALGVAGATYGFMKYQRAQRAAALAAEQAAEVAAPVQPIAAPVAAAASSAFGQPVEISPGAQAQPAAAAVAESASAALPAIANLPPPVQDPSAAPVPAQAGRGDPRAARPMAATTGQQQDGMVVISGDDPSRSGTTVTVPVPAKPLSQALVHTPGALQPPSVQAPAPVRPQPGPLDPAQPATAQRSPLAPPSGGLSQRTMRYGEMGIAALTANGVVVATRDKGQASVPIGGKLADGSTVIAVDVKSNRIITDRGAIQLN